MVNKTNEKEKTKLKKEYAKFVHELNEKKNATKFKRDVGLISLKELVKKGDISTKELKAEWTKAKKLLK